MEKALDLSETILANYRNGYIELKSTVILEHGNRYFVRVFKWNRYAWENCGGHIP